MNILIINLTRFGDLLQTQPVIYGLREQGHKVGLLCLENFVSTAALLEGLEYVAALPGAKILAALDGDWRQALGEFAGIVQDLEQHFPVDRVYNITATLSSRLLARLLSSSAPILGFGVDEDGFGVSGDAWATFLQGASAERINCPFNVVDMFRGAAGVERSNPKRGLRSPDASVLAQSLRILRENNPEAIEGYVAFQLGASETRRQWPVEYFVALGNMLWERFRWCPVLLGSSGERALAEKYAAKSVGVPYVDCVGGTDLPHLSGILLHARLLVSNDTGTMHLAAGLGVPVLGIFLSTAQPWDTAPYLPGCCCLEPALACHPCAFQTSCPHEHACLWHIQPAAVFGLVCSFAEKGEWALSVERGGTARVWVTCEGTHGFQDLLSISGHEFDERTAWLRMQRYFYRQIIDEVNGRAALEENVAPFFNVPLPQHLHQTLESLRQADQLFHLLYEQATLLKSMPKAQAGQRILGTCQRIHTVFVTCKPLAALGHLWLVFTQERGGDLDGVSRVASVMRKNVRAWHEVLLER